MMPKPIMRFAIISLVLLSCTIGIAPFTSAQEMFTASAPSVPEMTPTPTPTVSPSMTFKINFQPSNAEVPSGYWPDTGKKFGQRGEGRMYGWLELSNSQNRDRNTHPDQRYDTLNHMRRRTWEIMVPNGEYTVELVMGDPSYPDSVNSVHVENVMIPDPDGKDAFDEYTIPVTVDDGRLTISSTTYAKICFVTIIASGAIPTPTPSPTVMPTVTPTPQTYQLTIDRQGTGGGMVHGEGIACGHDCTEAYQDGTSLELHAYPDALSQFVNWFVDGEPLQEMDLAIHRDMTVTAVFDLVPPDCLPTNGGIEQCGDNIDNDCNGKIDEGCYDCRTDFEQQQCCRDDVCTAAASCEPGAAMIFLGCDNVACNPMVRCEDAPEGGPCECEIADDGLDNDCDGYVDEPVDPDCVN